MGRRIAYLLIIVAVLLVWFIATIVKASYDCREADELWTAGSKAEAVELYIDCAKYDDRSRRPTSYQRAIEFECDRKRFSSAYHLAIKAHEDGIELAFESGKATDIFENARRRLAAERKAAERAAAAKSRPKPTKDTPAPVEKPPIEHRDKGRQQEGGDAPAPKLERDRAIARGLSSGFVEGLSFGLVDPDEKRPAGPPIEVEAERLIADYEANEVAGNNLYRAKLLRVTGKVEAIREGIMHGVTVELAAGGGYRSVRCHLVDEATQEAAKLRKGQIATLEGVGGAYVLQSVTLDRVVIVR